MTGKWYKISADKNSIHEIKAWCDTNLGPEGTAWHYRFSTDIQVINTEWVHKHFHYVKIKNKKKAFAFLLTFR